MRFKPIFFFIALSFLSGCSFLNDEDITATPAQYPLQSIEVTLTRASLGDAEFEHFKISRGKIFRECGKYKTGKFIPSETSMLAIPTSSASLVQSQIDAFIEVYDEKTWQWEPAGRAKDLTDPGGVAIDLKAKNHHIVLTTSLDSVSGPKHRGERTLRALVRAVRNVALLPSPRNQAQEKKTQLCGNADFYGLGF